MPLLFEVLYQLYLDQKKLYSGLKIIRLWVSLDNIARQDCLNLLWLELWRNSRKDGCFINKTV
jgi:hypothetical protein